MYCTPHTFPKARKPHRCDSCAEPIEVGTRYVRWRCFMDGSAMTNKMHEECYSVHNAEGGTWEYTPFSYERPEERKLT
jgi:predicted RNA-binding Zn-ribbon protein involved in translation (DUF1610 family)